MENSYFFNSMNGDRTYQATDFANFYSQFLNEGIYGNGGQTTLKVIADGTDMRVNITAGPAVVQGYMYENTATIYLTHDAAEPTYDRIDRVVLRLDKTAENRFIKAFVKKGSPASSPVAPTLQRDDYIYEISLAQVRITAGKSYIEQSQIKDERGNRDVCGYNYKTGQETFVNLNGSPVQTLPAATVTKIQFSSINESSNGGEFDQALFRFNVPTDGIYLISVLLNATNLLTNEYLDARLFVNQSYSVKMGEAWGGSTATAHHNTIGGTIAKKLVKGDYIEIFSYASKSTNIDGYSKWSVVKLV